MSRTCTIVEEQIDVPNGTVLGDMSIKRFVELPKGLSVQGNLIIDAGCILPEDLYVMDSLILHKPVIFPKKFKINRISLIGQENIILPDSLCLETLFLNNSGLEKLPSDLKVRNVSIFGSILKMFPKDMKFLGGSLTLKECPYLTQIPCHFKNFHYLDLSNSKIKELSRNINTAYLDIINTKIHTLPDGLTVTKRMNLSGCTIKHIGRVNLSSAEVITADFYLNVAKENLPLLLGKNPYIDSVIAGILRKEK